MLTDVTSDLEACFKNFVKTDYALLGSSRYVERLDSQVSSSVRMAGKKWKLVWLMHLDKVPAREEHMTPYESYA